MDHWDVQAATAGRIADADRWKLNDMKFAIADGSAITLVDTKDVTGIPAATQATSPLPTPEMQAIIDKDTSRPFWRCA